MNKSTRAHIIFTHFYSLESILSHVNNVSSTLIQGMFPYRNNKLLFTNKRRIHDEYRYCIDRTNQPTINGNALHKPSFLIKPLQRRATTTGIQHVRMAAKMNKKNEAVVSYVQVPRDSSAQWVSSNTLHDTDISLEFLQHPSTILFNIIPDKNGYIYIDKTLINSTHKIMHIIVADEYHSKCKSFSMYKSITDVINEIKTQQTHEEKKSDLEGNMNQYKDIRQKISKNAVNNIDKLTLKQENRYIILLHRDEEHIVYNFKCAEIETYASIKHMYSLLTALSKENSNHLKLDALLKKWSFISEWNKFSSSQKLTNYGEHFCHELNLFLFIKDKPFFNQIVKPLIQSKLHKDMMDYFLLNDIENLQKYSQPHLFDKLNPLEIILLTSTKLDPDLKEKTLNYFLKTQETLKERPQKMDKLFRTALAEKQL
eukprot:521583_1